MKSSFAARSSRPLIACLRSAVLISRPVETRVYHWTTLMSSPLCFPLIVGEEELWMFISSSPPPLPPPPPLLPLDQMRCGTDARQDTHTLAEAEFLLAGESLGRRVCADSAGVCRNGLSPPAKSMATTNSPVRRWPSAAAPSPLRGAVRVSVTG